MLKNDLVVHFPALGIWFVIFMVLRLTGSAFSVARIILQRTSASLLLPLNKDTFFNVLYYCYSSPLQCILNSNFNNFNSGLSISLVLYIQPFISIRSVRVQQVFTLFHGFCHYYTLYGEICCYLLQQYNGL